MNTVKSFWVGMSALTAAGGIAYYLAKKDIDADRAAKYQREQLQRRRMQELEYNSRPSIHDPSGSPSSETAEPAPTRHAPDSEEAKVLEKSKYEATEPFRSKKGDRFS